MPNPRALSPETLTRIAGLKLEARRAVEGMLTGQHRSPHHGVSIEFTEHKEYAEGDDIRRLDWRVLGRSDRYYIKKYEKETNLRAMLLLDASGSMEYHSHGLSKLDFSAQLALALAYLFLKQSDSVGLLARQADEKYFLPAAAQSSHFQLMAEMLAGLSGRGVTDLGAWIPGASESLGGRGLCLVISDFLCDAAATAAGLRLLASQRRELIVFHVLDPFELQFPFHLRTRFKDMEMDRELTVEPLAVKRSYLALLDEHIKGLKHTCREIGADYALCDTSVPLERHLIGFLGRRMEK
jgi:uncharacterized protein (DUF58 family)